MSKNVLLVSDTMIKERTAMHSNVEPKLLYPDIKVVQDMYIHPLLGSALYKKIQSDIAAETIAGVYKELLDDFICDCLIYYTLSELPPAMSFQFTNRGVTRKSGENTENPSMGELYDISSHYRKRAEWYAERLRKHLKEHSTDFTEYLNPGNGVDAINPANKAYTCPIVLDDCDYQYKSYEEKYQGNKPNCC